MPEHKTVPFELTKVDGDARTFEGYASTWRDPGRDQPDHTGDMVVAGAFKKSLAERGGKVRLLWQHDPSQPIGKWLDMREDGKGLFVKGVISDTRLGRDCLALLKDKAIDSMSIGYDALPGGTEFVKGKGGQTVRLLKEIRLWEVSLVTFPADEQAKVTAVKGALPFVATDKAPEDTAWDGPGVMAMCEGRDQFRRVCAWVDPDGDPESKSSYKLPHHMPDGQVVWKGVAAAMQRLGGTQIPEGDMAGVRSHLARHYAQFDKPVPGEGSKEMSPRGPIRRLGDMLQGTIHRDFTLMCDEWYVEGLLSREERISLSSAIGDCLDMLTEKMPTDLAMRELGPMGPMMMMMAAPFDVETKAGRRLSAATLSKIEAAMAALRDLMGEMDMPAQDEQDSPKADNPPAETQQAGQDTPTEQKAGPDTAPPTTPESAADAAGPDVTPPTSSEAVEPNPDDPLAVIAAQQAEIKALLDWR